MNQDEIISMAKEARIHRDDSWRFEMLSERNALEAFAALVAAAEREACARVCDVITEKNTWWDINEIEAAEECAAEIRARGEAK
jgi:hypothetical protein